MSSTLAEDKNKYIVLFINDFYPEFATAFNRLSKTLGRPLRGIMLIDAERKANGKNLPDKEGVFEEIVVDFSDDADLKRAIKPLEEHLLLVTCASERSQLYFKRVIPHVPYIHTPTERSIDYSTHKGLMREQLISYNDDISPKVMVVSNASQSTVKKIQETLAFPLIIKPTGLDASKLVNKVHDEHQLQQTLTDSFAVIDEIYSKYRGLGDKTMIVEEFIDGDTYSADVYVNSVGKVYVLPFISFKNGVQAGFDGYQIYRSDSHHTLSNDEIAAGQEVARQAVHAIGLRSSVAHIELFHVKHNEGDTTKSSWKIVELGARPGGWRQETYSASYDIDHALNELLVKIDLEPDMPTTMKAYSTTFRVHAPEAGVLESIDGLEDVKANPSIHTLTINAKPGDTVLPSAQGGTMIVGGLLHNSDLDELNRHADHARTKISVKIANKS